MKIFHSSTPRYSTDIEVQEMNAMVNDIERALSSITQQMKQVNLSLPSFFIKHLSSIVSNRHKVMQRIKLWGKFKLAKLLVEMRHR